jgi:hypothetical protein
MVVVGKAKKIVGQHAVVGRAVVVEELDIRLYVFDGEGLPRSVAPVDAVESSTHTSPVACRSASRQHCQYDKKTYHQLFHGSKGTNKPAKYQIIEMLMFPNNDGPLFYFSALAASKVRKRLTNT